MQPVPGEALQRRLSLYRSLLSLIRIPRAEDEVIRFVVETIYEHFPDCRACISRLDEKNIVHLLYSRQAAGLPSLEGQSVDLGEVPGLAQQFREGKALVVKDLREVPAFAPYVGRLLGIGGNPCRLDVPFVDPEGEVGILSLGKGVPTFWDQETVDVMKEISELVRLILRDARTQKNLRRTETIFHQFANSVNVVFWMSDPRKNEMTYVSPAYEQIWGRSVDSLYREPLSFLDAVHCDDHDRVAEAIRKQPEGPYEQIYRVVRPNGELRWVKDRGFRVRGENGEVLRIAGITEDITLLREAEERLKATQAQVISNAKFAALGEMASGIAHEINNPLAVIHGLSVQLQELFRNGAAPTSMVLESLGSVEKMANRIAGIVKGLRTFSRQTEGDPMSPTDLSSVVQETMAMCEAKLRAAGILVSVNALPGQAVACCRSSEISQVLLNLVSNAYDAVVGSANGAVAVDVRREGRFARIVVEDSGPGIDPAQRDRIFQPFFTTKDVGHGTGLGLSISKGIVEAHGGALFLDTASRKTRFVVELPAHEEI